MLQLLLNNDQILTYDFNTICSFDLERKNLFFSITQELKATKCTGGQKNPKIYTINFLPISNHHKLTFCLFLRTIQGGLQLSEFNGSVVSQHNN